MFKKYFLLVGVVAFGVLSASCAGTTNYQYPNIDQFGSETASLHFVRKDSFYGGAIAAKISIDGNLVGELGPGDSLTTKVPASRILISTKRSNIKKDAERGRHYYFEVYLPFNGPLATNEFELSAISAQRARELGLEIP
jgi:hypothetical protein